MAEAVNISKNQTVEIEVNEKQRKVAYLSSVLKVCQDCFIFLLPADQAAGEVLRPGQRIVVSFYDHVAFYSFSAVVLEVSKPPMPRVKVSLPEKVSRTQRRNFVRINARIPLEYYLVCENLAERIAGHQATTLDISGGGVLIKTDQKLDPGAELEITFGIPGKGKVFAIGKVIRCCPDSNQQKFRVGIQFTLIEKKDREKIIRYIFEQQRMLRKKGLI